jgi:hypothetical protein
MSHHTPELARRRGGTTNGASSNQGWSGVDVAEPPDLGSESDFTGLNDNGSAVDGSGTTAMPGLDTSGEYTEEADTAAGADEEGNEDDSETLESVRQATTCLQVGNSRMNSAPAVACDQLAALDTTLLLPLVLFFIKPRILCTAA